MPWWCRSPPAPRHITGPIDAAILEHQLWDDPERRRAPAAIRIDGDFEMVRVRSVPKQLLAGIEIVGFHLHFVCDRRLHGGHVLDFTLREATVRIDEATELHVELPAAVEPPDRRWGVDQAVLRRLEGA